MSIMQSILQQIYAGTHAPLVAPGNVPMLASPDAAVLDPNTPGAAQPQAPQLAVNSAPPIPGTEPEDGAASAATPQGPAPSQGLMGTLGSILAPQAGSFWASALKHGLAGASQGMIDDPLAHAMGAAQLQAEQGKTASAVAEGARQKAGIITDPNGNIIQLGQTPGAPVSELYHSEDKTERLIDKWQTLSPEERQGPLGQAIQGAALGRAFAFMPQVLAAQNAAKVQQIQTNNATKRFAPKGGGKAAATRPPPGFQ